MSRPRGYSEEDFKNTRLINAAGNGDINSIREQLEAVPPPTAQDCAMGMYRAALYGHYEALKLLLDSGGDCNTVTDTHGRTPLFAAASSRFPAITTALLEAGADASLVNQEGWTPLHVASSYGNEENVLLLLKYGACPNISDNSLDTPLTMSCRLGHIGVVRALLAAGVDVNGDGRSSCALKVAALFGHVAAVEALLEVPTVDVEARDGTGETPFITAARARSATVLRLLSKSGADINAQSNAGYSALHVAVANGNAPMARELLRIGCNQDVRARDGRSPADCAPQGKDGAAVLAVLEIFRAVHYPRMYLLILVDRMEKGRGPEGGARAWLGDLEVLNSDVLRHIASCMT